MYYLLLCLIMCTVASKEEYNLYYDLHLGHSIDLFANYGELGQVAQVIAADFESEEIETEEPFRERNLKVFENVTGSESNVTDTFNDIISLMFCDTFDDLLDNYFIDFHIEGTKKPWKAFLGDWIYDEVLRSFGISKMQPLDDTCCYVLARMSKKHRSVKLDPLTDVTVQTHVAPAIRNLNASDPAQLKRFIKNYGTHYIESYTTGNSIYQVFKFKRDGYNLLKSHVRRQSSIKRKYDSLRFYFSSLFLKQVGDIKVASGNKTVEKWARKNLKDSQYLYFRPTLLKLFYQPTLVYKLEELLDNGALLGLDLKILRPLFKDEDQADKFLEVVDNDMQLWEVNTYVGK